MNRRHFLKSMASIGTIAIPLGAVAAPANPAPFQWARLWTNPSPPLEGTVTKVVSVGRAVLPPSLPLPDLHSVAEWLHAEVTGRGTAGLRRDRPISPAERRQIEASLQGTHLVFVLGDEGDGLTSAVTNIAYGTGALTIHLPPLGREWQAESLQRKTGGPLIIPIPLDARADALAVRTLVSDLPWILRQGTSIVNVDFEDVRTVLGLPGRASLGFGRASGPNRVPIAVERAVADLIPGHRQLSRASGVFVTIGASSSLTMKEIHEAMNEIKGRVWHNAEVMFATVFDDELGDVLRISLITIGRA